MFKALWRITSAISLQVVPTWLISMGDKAGRSLCPAFMVRIESTASCQQLMGRSGLGQPGELARRHARHHGFPLCGLARTRGASGLRAKPTASRTMAVVRVAKNREGADKVLAVEPARIDQPSPARGYR